MAKASRSHPSTRSTCAREHLTAPLGHRPHHQHGLTPARAPDQVGADELDAVCSSALLLWLIQGLFLQHVRPASSASSASSASEEQEEWLKLGSASPPRVEPSSVRWARALVCQAQHGHREADDGI